MKKCQENQHKLLHTHAVKRVISPPKDERQKENTTDLSNTRNARKQLFTPLCQNPQVVSTAEIYVNIPNFSKPHFISVLHPINCLNAGPGESVYSSSKDIFLSQPIKQYEVETLQRSIETRIPSAIAGAVTKMGNINYAIKTLFTKAIDESCKKLCWKANGTLLYDTDYNNMAEFDFKLLYDEIKTNLPFLIDILNTVSGQHCSIDDTPLHLKVKYGFIYAILMNTRWHALSLLQRINTVLMIEGGCSKKVMDTYILIF